MILLSPNTGEWLSRVCGLVLFTTLLAPPVLDAATYYAATTGSDSNPGTLSQPFRTIRNGAKLLKPGDTLYVRNGVYTESLDDVIPGGLSWQQPVTISAYPGERPTIRPVSGHVIVLYCDYVHHVVIDGFILDGSNTTPGANGLKLASDPTCGVAHHIRLQNSEIKNTPNSGIFVGGHPYPGFLSDAGCCNEFINLDIHDNAVGMDDQGYYIQSGRNLIERNRVYRNSCCGIYIFRSDSSTPHDNIVRDNEVFDNGLTSPSGGGVGILVQGERDQVYNNIVYGNRLGGIYVFGDGRDIKVMNNTVYNNQGPGVIIDATTSNTSVKNNILYQNAGVIQNQGSGTIISNNLTLDPLFVNTATKNFSLKAGSPAIDKGMPLSEVFDDFAGLARPQGPAYDIGAFEYTGTAPVPPTNLKAF
jgi:parallel beta-helix repeat protein